MDTLMKEKCHGFLIVNKHGTSSSPVSAFPSIVELARLFCTRAKIGHCVDFFDGNMDRAMESQCRVMESLQRAMERLTRAMERLTWCNGKLVIVNFGFALQHVRLVFYSSKKEPSYKGRIIHK